MQKLKEHKWIIIILFLVLGIAFYWYEYKPHIAKKKCSSIVEDTIIRESLTRDPISYQKYQELSNDKQVELIQNVKSKIKGTENEGLLYGDQGYKEMLENCLKANI